MQPETDPLSVAQRMRDRIAKIRDDPARAFFSDFKATSAGGITVSVDLLGRLKRVELRPGTLYEGGEPWLVNEIMSAYQAAVQAANYLEFDQAQFAKELNEVPALKAKLETEATQRDTTARQTRARRDNDDDFGQGGILRRR